MFRRQFTLHHHAIPLKISETQLKEPKIEQQQQQQAGDPIQWRDARTASTLTGHRDDKTQRAAADKTQPLHISFPTSDSAARTKRSRCAPLLGRTAA